MLTNDQLQNELILIKHHIGDIREYMNKDAKVQKEMILSGLKDVLESVERLEKFLSEETLNEIDRIAGDVS